MKLTDQQIAEQSHQLLDGLGEEGIRLFTTVEKYLGVMDAPEISWEMQSVDTGLLRALSGRRRDFLEVRHSKLPEHVVLIASRAYGTALMASWMLIATPRISREIVRAMRVTTDGRSRHDIGAELDIFAMMDLNAFIAITRLALKKAISDLTDDVENVDDDTPSERGSGPSA